MHLCVSSEETGMMALAQLQPPDARRDKRPSTAGNSNVSKDSEPQVISSLIASLDQRDSPFTHASYTYVSAADHDDDNGGFYSHPSLRPPLKQSQSFGMDYGAHRSPSRDQDYDSDGADFPVIRTARRPSGKSTHTAPPSPGLNGLRDILRSTSKTSLLLNGSDRLSRSNSRLSADSRARKQTSPTKLSLDTASERLGCKTSLRQTSRETLRSYKDPQQSADQALLGQLAGDSTDPPRGVKNTKGRLYLEDVIEDMASPSPNIPVTRSSRPSSSRGGPAKTPAESPVASSSGSTLPASSVIPPRSSSLNKISSPTKSKAKKLSKGKRALAALKEERPRRKSKAEPPRDLFDGLDDEDQTVKRIRELRQQKQDRLRVESEALQTLNDRRHVHDSATSSASSKLDPQKLPANKVAARTPDLSKAHRMLGIDVPPSKSPVVHRQKSATVSPVSANVRSPPSVTRDSASREAHANSSLPPDSPILGNAFSTSTGYYRPFHTQIANVPGEQAYDSSSVGRRAVARKSTQSHLLNGLDIEGLEMSPPSTAHSNSTFQSRSRPSSSRRMSSYDARIRRKSMSDARENRLLEDDVLRERDNNVSIAVNSFLSSPRLNQRICHPQTGRIISFSEVGDPNGSAVIVCVGMGLTRFVSVFYDDLATSLGLRLITPERPGVGASEAHRDRDHIGPLAWPDDVLTITHHLGISQFSLIAHSAGAIYALATALILPHCVRGKVQLLAPWIPPSQFENINQKDKSPDNVPVAALTRGQRFLRVLPVPFLKAANGNLFAPASLKPTNVKGNGSGSPGSESPRGVPRRRNSKKRPDALRRESMILMDQVIPERPRDTMFPLPELCEDEKTGVEKVRKPSDISLKLSATASPTDPALLFAAEALSAAEHAAREHQAAYSSLLTERTWDLATRDSNPAADLIICLERHREIGFRYVDVHRKVVITHGTEDKRVPVENIRWIGDQMNRFNTLHLNLREKDEPLSEGGCEIRILPGEGHGLMANPGVMADVLSEISGEWLPTRW